MVAALIAAGHEVAWAVEPAAAPLVSTIRGLAHTFILPKASAFDWNDRFRLARVLRDYEPDVAIDAQGLWKSAFWTWLFGRASTHWLDGGPAPRGRLPRDAHRDGACSPADVHVIDQHHSSWLTGIGIDDRGGREFPYVLPADAVAMANAFRELSASPLRALISPGGGMGQQALPGSAVGTGCSRHCRHESDSRRLVGSRRGGTCGRSRGPASRGTARIAPRTSILELAALASVARIFLAADTGPASHRGCHGRTARRSLRADGSRAKRSMVGPR